MTGTVEQIGRLLDTLTLWIVGHATIAVIAVVGVTAAVCAAQWRVRSRRHARMRRNAVIVTVLPPPRVDPAGAVMFWSNLLRPVVARVRRGQPHLVFEYGFTPTAWS